MYILLECVTESLKNIILNNLSDLANTCYGKRQLNTRIKPENLTEENNGMKEKDVLFVTLGSVATYRFSFNKIYTSDNNTLPF